MGNIIQGIPTPLVLKLKQHAPILNFIETGTFKGNTARWAAQHFNKAVTIEINPQCYEEAKRNTSNLPNLEFLLGDSAALLPQVVAKLEGRSLFWLDGHYSGAGTGGEVTECPILEELEALKNLPDPLILIDDARCFLGPPPPPHKAEGWPRIDKIFQTLATLFPDYYTTIHDDVIISVPIEYHKVITQDWADHWSQRYPTKSPVNPSFLTRFFQK
jgi:hypothetical protein